MKTEIRGGASKDAGACVLYDGECPLCIDSARRFEGTLRRRGFELATLQSRENSPVAPSEMRVLTADGRAHGGAAALVQIARRVWWAWPLFAVAQLPGAMRVFNAGYRWLARNRGKLSVVIRSKTGVAPQKENAPKLPPKRRTSTFFEMP